MKIYLDKDFHCHVSDGSTIVQSIETDFFNDKCDAFIEGYRFVPAGESWTRNDGVVFYGEMIAPFKPYDELVAAQHEYDRNLLVEYKAELAALDAALLDAQYNMLIGGL